ncbi:MAG: flavodoxin domain-containing protein [Dethiobacteria bacterium]|nr:flavodoxin domain-containing protein [Dethiobacteria bacterium]
MDIGLIIYSGSGNTRSVAVKLQEKLTAAGHAVSLEEITITGNTPAQSGKFELKQIPAVDSYDALIFGAPVQAFSLNPVMKAYMAQLPPLNAKRVALFVTKQLALLRLGGTGAIAAMKKEVETRGGKVIGSEIVVWAEKKRAVTTQKCIDSISKLF